jgi:branched-chain amino acid transport system substrate-binding protein
VPGANALISAGARHLFGTTTSTSRKELIPELEHSGSLLWYPCPYEGYECSENVIYFGACPNQTLLPLLRYALSEFGGRSILIGSNYIWGWESNRIARELVELAGGQVLAERYHSLGDVRLDSLIASIINQRPDFVLNNLVGESSYHFLQRLDTACGDAGLSLPVLSCNFTESEMGRVGSLRNIRLLSCGPFFESLDPAFVDQQRLRHGDQPYSHYYVSAYLSLKIFAAAFRKAGTDDPAALKHALYSMRPETVLGQLTIAENNNHFALPSVIAEAVNRRFELVHRSSSLLAADPYLTQSDLVHFGTQSTQLASQLRVVK